MSDQPVPSGEDGWVHRTVGPTRPVAAGPISYGSGMFDLLPDGVAVLDRDLRVLAANRAFRQLLGLDYLGGTDAPTLSGRIDLQVGLPNEPEMRPLERVLRLAESIGLPLAIDGAEISLPRSYRTSRCSLSVIPGLKHGNGRAPLLVWIRPAEKAGERPVVGEIPWPSGLTPRDLIALSASVRTQRFTTLPSPEDEPHFPTAFTEYLVLALPIPLCVLTPDFNVRETNPAIGRMLSGSDLGNGARDRSAFSMFPELAAPEFRRALEESRERAEPRSTRISLRFVGSDEAHFDVEVHPVATARGDVRQILLAFHPRRAPSEDASPDTEAAVGRALVVCSDPWVRVMLSSTWRRAGFSDIALAPPAGPISPDSLADFDIITAGDACDPELIRSICERSAVELGEHPVLLVAERDEAQFHAASGIRALPLLGRPGFAVDTARSEENARPATIAGAAGPATERGGDDAERETPEPPDEFSDAQTAESFSDFTDAESAEPPAVAADADENSAEPFADPEDEDAGPDEVVEHQLARAGEPGGISAAASDEHQDFDWGSLGMFQHDSETPYEAEKHHEETSAAHPSEESFVAPSMTPSRGDRAPIAPIPAPSSTLAATGPTPAVSREIGDLLTALDLLWDFRKLCVRVLEMALATSGGKSGSLMMLDASGRELRIVAAKGLSDVIAGRTRQRMGEGIAGLVAETGQPLLLQGRVGDNRFRGMGGRPEIGSSLVVPVRLENRVIGVLNVTGSAQGPSFTEADLAKMVGLGQQVGMPLHRSREIAFMSRRSFELSVRKEIEEIVASGGTMVERLQRVAASVRRTLEAESLLIYLLDEKHGELSLQVAAGWSLETAGVVKVPLGIGLVGRVAQTLTPSVLTTSESLGEISEGPNNNTIAVPIRYLTQLVGVVVLETTSVAKSGEDYMDRALSVVSAVGHYLGDAWGREDSEERLTMISAVGEMAVSFSSASDLRALARLVAFCASPVLGGDVAVVRFVNPGEKVAEGAPLKLMGVEGVSFPSEGDPLVELDECLALAVKAAAEPRKDSDLPADLRRQLLRRANVGAALSVPIHDDEHLVGTLTVYKALGSGRTDSSFGVRELEAACRMADFAAAAAIKHLARPGSTSSHV